MQYFSLFILSAAIALSGALMPGPLLTAVIAQSVQHGARSGPLLILGHAILEAAMVAAIIAGLGRFVNNPAAMSAVALAGACMLGWFGLTMIASLPRLSLDTRPAPAKNTGLVMMGITVSLSNPYWSIWWLSIGMGLVLTAGNAGPGAVAVFFLGHICADLGWYSFVSLAISKSKKFISLRTYRIIILACALALLGFAVWFGLSGLALSHGS